MSEERSNAATDEAEPERLDDQALARLVKERANQPTIQVSVEDLLEPDGASEGEELRAEEIGGACRVGTGPAERVMPEAVTRHNSPRGYNTARLGDVTESMKNGLYKPASEYDDDGVPCLRMYNIEAGQIVWRDIKRMRVTPNELTDYGLREGDLLVNRVNSRELVGKTALIPQGMELSVFESKNIRLRLKAERALPKFINFQLLAFGRRHFSNNAQQVVGMASVSQKQLADFPIVLAPLDQQIRIVAEIEKQFSRLDEAVANLKRVKANLKRYKAAVLKAAVEGRLVETEAELARREGRSYETGEQLLQRILETRRSQWKGKGKYKEPAAPDTTDLPELPEGWVGAVSDVIFDFVTSGSRGWAQYYSNSGAIFLRVGNLDHRTIDLDLSEIQYVRPPANPEADRSRVEPGDLLISITAELGMVAVAPENLGDAYVNQHVAIARSTDLVEKNYIGWYFACEHAGKKQLETLRRGATKAGLGLDDMRSVYIAIPPLAEQQRIISEIDRRLSLSRETEAQVDVNLQRAERLRQSILSRAFSGDLLAASGLENPIDVGDVPLPAVEPAHCAVAS